MRKLQTISLLGRYGHSICFLVRVELLFFSLSRSWLSMRTHQIGHASNTSCAIAKCFDELVLYTSGKNPFASYYLRFRMQ